MSGRQPEPKWRQAGRDKAKAETLERQARRAAKLELERLRGQRRDMLDARLRARERERMVEWRAEQAKGRKS